MDKGETPLEAAKRELAEETKLKGDLELINLFYSSPGFIDEKIYLFHATNLSPAHGELDEGEELTVVWHDAKTLWEDIKAGKTASSSPSVLALNIALQQASLENVPESS